MRPAISKQHKTLHYCQPSPGNFKPKCKYRCLLVELFLSGILLGMKCLDVMASESSSFPTNPHYILKLTLNEFSILNVSEMDGLLKYGGSGDFKLSMAKEGSNVVWNVTVDNPRLMELLGIFVGEKTMKLVQSLDPNNLDPNQKIVLEAIKPLNFSHIVVGRVT